MKTGIACLSLSALLFHSADSCAAPVFDPAQQPPGFLAPLALSGTNLEAGQTSAYRSWFDGKTWEGGLIRYDINNQGDINTSDKKWSAREIYAAQENTVGNYWNKRIIVTMLNNQGIPFRSETLHDTQLTALNRDKEKAKQIVNFIRGDRSHEGELRRRTSLLGDIIHSPPVFVGTPSAHYSFDNYDEFKLISRPALIYVGANDGMLHAYNADNGKEIYAYIPSMLITKLNKLAGHPYTHTYFVDGDLVSGDVYFRNQGWRTLLIGGLGAGGRGLFALDVTSAAADDEGQAAAKILWEIGSDQDQDLGDTYSRPVITRLNDGKWYVIIGNGYNTAHGKALLYLIDAVTGEIIRKIATDGSGTPAYPNGLSSPTAIDTDNDDKADYVYAGDIDGNVWKFDLTGANPYAWHASYNGTPLFKTDSGDQAPVIMPPVIARHPHGGYLVYFGTGRLFDADDIGKSNTRQSIYAIWDKGNFPITGDSLFIRELRNHNYADGIRVRTTSAIQLPDWARHHGWRITLPAGERLLTPLKLRAKRLQMVVTNPLNKDNWLMEIDYLSGGAPPKPVFDLNGDSVLSETDRIDTDTGDNGSNPLGLKLADGLMAGPTLIRIKNGTDAAYINGSSGTRARMVDIMRVFNPMPGPKHGIGRYSWAELTLP